jgi:hypothetical protein
MKKITSVIKKTIGNLFPSKDSSETNSYTIDTIDIDDLNESAYYLRATPITLPKVSSLSQPPPSLEVLPVKTQLTETGLSLQKISTTKHVNVALENPHSVETPSLELYKNSKDEQIISLDVYCIIDYVIDKISSAYYESNMKIHSNALIEYYNKQLEYESELASILNTNELYSIKKCVDGIINKDKNFIFNLRSIKLYATDYIIPGVCCGVFKTSDLIIKVDRLHDSFKSELFAMSYLGKGIIKPYNIVLPYIVKLHNSRKKNKLCFSIQPRIVDSFTIYDWMKLISNRRLNIDTYISICIGVSRTISFLHSKDFVHGDIKPGNILIQNITNIPYIIDFGLCGINAVSEGTGGTKPYCNPTTLNVYNDKEDSYEWTKISKNNDLWSISLLFATIIIFRYCYNLYADYPSDFFDSEKYVTNKYIQYIPFQFREAFQLVLINPKHRVNNKQININKFIEMLELGMSYTNTVFNI